MGTDTPSMGGMGDLLETVEPRYVRKSFLCLPATYGRGSDKIKVEDPSDLGVAALQLADLRQANCQQSSAHPEANLSPGVVERQADSNCLILIHHHQSSTQLV